VDHGDVIKITHEGAGISGVQVIIERATIPLSWREPMTMTVKRRITDPNV
jgi:hypothetical protein